MNVEHWDEAENGPLAEESMRALLRSRGYAVACYSYPPGTVFPDHTHGIDKIDGVLRGRFRMTTAEGSVVLEAGDMLAVPRGTVHSAEVVGGETVVSLDATRG